MYGLVKRKTEIVSVYVREGESDFVCVCVC